MSKRYYLKNIPSVNHYKFPMLSDFIKDLCVVLNRYGDHRIRINGEYSDEIDSIAYYEETDMYVLDNSERDEKIPYELDELDFIKGLYKILTNNNKEICIKNIVINDNFCANITLADGNTIHIDGRYMTNDEYTCKSRIRSRLFWHCKNKFAVKELDDSSSVICEYRYRDIKEYHSTNNYTTIIIEIEDRNRLVKKEIELPNKDFAFIKKEIDAVLFQNKEENNEG